MASWEHTALKVWALLKHFLLQHTVKSPIRGDLCSVATPGGVEMKLCPFSVDSLWSDFTNSHYKAELCSCQARWDTQLPILLCPLGVGSPNPTIEEGIETYSVPPFS